MASRLYDAMFTQGTHEIGNLNTIWAKPVVNGAVALGNMDNFTLAEITGYDDDGNLKCQQLSAVANEGFLVATIEEEHLMEGETYVDFYNAKDEVVRLIRLETGVRFEVSAFSLNEGVSSVARGMVAHFDPTTKKFIVSNAGTPHADYATAVNQFEVVNPDTDFGFAFDKTTIRLECK